MRSSQTTAARLEYEAAEAQRKRRCEENGLQFASVKHAVRFLWERGSLMQAPLAHHPRGHKAADGSTVYLDVDGGKKADIHDVFATLQSIHDALEELRRDDPVSHRLFVLHMRDGKTMIELGILASCSATTASREVGKAERFLLGWLRSGGVILPTVGAAP